MFDDIKHKFLDGFLNQFGFSKSAGSDPDFDELKKPPRIILFVLERDQSIDGVHYLTDQKGDIFKPDGTPLIYTKKICCGEDKAFSHVKILGHGRIQHKMKLDEFHRYNENFDKSQIRIELLKSEQRRKKYGYQVFQTPDGHVEATGIRIHVANSDSIPETGYKFGADNQVIGTYAANDIDLLKKKRKIFIDKY
jgi:hypothetical protein